MRLRLLLPAAVLAATATLAAQATIAQLRLTEGTHDETQVSSPVYDGAVPLTIAPFTSTYDKKALFVRRMGGNMFTRGPEYRLAQTIDVGALLTESLTTQAAAMGFATKPGGWQVSGAISDVFLESRQVPYGATLFYGYLVVDVKLSGPGGKTHAATYRLHNYSGGYNAGMGRRDEAETSAARLLVEGAQELLARLNRSVIRARAHSGMATHLETLKSAPIDKQRSVLRMVGLSGVAGATDVLLARLPTEKSESTRAAIINALATLGAPAAVPVLAGRYSTEDEDPRWYTLKAMDYIGGAEAMKVVASLGAKDKDNGPRRLAQRIAGK